MRRDSMLDRLRYPRQFLRKAVWTHRSAVPMNPAPTCSSSGYGLSRAQITGDGDVWEFGCVTVIWMSAGAGLSYGSADVVRHSAIGAVFGGRDIATGPTGLALILAALRDWTGTNVSHLKVPVQTWSAAMTNDEVKGWRT